MRPRRCGGVCRHLRRSQLRQKRRPRRKSCPTRHRQLRFLRRRPKRRPARPAPSKNTTRTKPVTEVESRRSALAVEPVHAVEPRDSSARQAPTPPPEKPRLFQPASQAPQSSSWTAATIRDLENRWQTAIKNHDVETIEKLLSDDLEATSVTGAKGGKKDVLRALKNDKSVYKSVRAENMR